MGQIIDGESNNDYHAKHEWISSSRLKAMGRSPMHFQLYHHYQKEPTEAMVIGSATHTAVLEPDKFDQEYVVLTERIDRRTKAGKEAWDKFYVENIGKTVLTADQFEKIDAMKNSVLGNQVMAKFLQKGIAEQSMYWTDEVTQIGLKCRPDWRRGSTIIDLKTTTDASPDFFFRAMAYRDYALSAALYTEGCYECLGHPIKFFLYCAVESEPPYGCMMYRLTENDMEAARFRMRSYLSQIRACMNSSFWGSYETLEGSNDGIMDIVLPKFAK